MSEHTIYIGDCREKLKLVPDNSVHLIVTSPPYNVGMNYQVVDDRQPYQTYLNMLDIL